MNFTKEEARKELAAKFSKKVEKIDKWDRTIKENVETLFSLIGENSEISLDDFCSKAMPLLETTAGFIRKENSDIAQKFNIQIEELKTQIEKKEEPKKDEKDDVNGLLSKRIEALENELRNERYIKSVQEKRNEILNKIKDGGVKNDEWVSMVLSKANITDETDVDSEAKSYIEMYNKFASKVPTDVTPDGAHSSPKEKTSEVIKLAGEIAKSQNQLK